MERNLFPTSTTGRPSAQQTDASTVKAVVDIPIPPARNAPGSNPDAATSGSVPSWLSDKDQQPSSSSQLPLSSGEASSSSWGGSGSIGSEKVRDKPVPFLDLSQGSSSSQQRDFSRQPFIREVPRSTREDIEPEKPLNSPRAAATTTAAPSSSSSSSHVTPPASKLSDITAKIADLIRPDETKTAARLERCPLPLPNFQSWINQNVPAKIQYILYYRDPVYSFLVLGGVAGLLHLLVSGYTFKIFLVLAFLMKWAMLGALALSGGFYAYKKYFQKDQHPVNYVETHFKPRIERYAARVARVLPPQDAVLDKLNCAVRLAYSAPRKFLDTLYSNNWLSMTRGLIALQFIQTVLCWFSPRAIIWMTFGLICTLPKLYQMYRVPIDKFINFFHSQLVALCHACETCKPKVAAAAAKLAPTSDTTTTATPTTTTATGGFPPITTSTILPASAGVPATIAALGGVPVTTVTTIITPAEKVATATEKKDQ